VGEEKGERERRETEEMELEREGGREGEMKRGKE